MAREVQKPFNLSALSFHLADSRCKSKDVPSQITFSAKTKVLRNISEITVSDLIIDGKKCASATRVAGLLDVESFISGTRNSIVGKKLVSFFMKNSRFPEKIENMLENILKKVGEFPEKPFLGMLLESASKAAIFHTT